MASGIISGVSWVVLQTDWGQSKAVELTESTYNSIFHSQLQIESVSGVLPWYVDLHEAYLILEKDGLRSDTLVYAEKISAETEIWPLLQQQIRFVRLELLRPTLNFSIEKDSLVFKQAFKRKRAPLFKFIPEQFYAPNLTIIDGGLHFKGWDIRIPKLPEEFVLSQVEFDGWVEWNDEYTFLDITSLSTRFPEFTFEELQVSGQVFYDGNSFELNQMDARTKASMFVGSIGIRSSEASEDEFFKAWINHSYSLEVNTLTVEPKEWEFVYQDFEKLRAPIQVTTSIDGNKEEIGLNSFKLAYNQNELEVVGTLFHPMDSSKRSYDLSVRNGKTNSSLYDELGDYYPALRAFRTDSLSLTGRLWGNSKEADIYAQLGVNSSEIELKGAFQLSNEVWVPNFNIATKNLDLSTYKVFSELPSSVNAHFSISGIWKSKQNYELKLVGEVEPSSVKEVSIQRSTLETKFTNEEINHTSISQFDGHTLVVNGAYSLGEYPSLVGDLELYGFNLKRFGLGKSSSIDFKSHINANNLGLSSLYGSISLDVLRGRVGTDTLAPHQFYADLNKEESRVRELRITSTIADVFITGAFNVDQIIAYWKRWQPSIIENILRPYKTEEDLLPWFNESPPLKPMFISAEIEPKATQLLHVYVPLSRSFQLSDKQSFQLSGTDTSLVSTGYFSANAFEIESLSAQETQLNYTMSFSKQGKVNSLALSALVDSMEVNGIPMDDIRVNFSQTKDLFSSSFEMNSSPLDAFLMGSFQGDFAPNTVNIIVDSLQFGRQNYYWSSTPEAKLTLTGAKRVQFQEFKLQNGNQTIELRGNLSPQSGDSVIYKIESLDLGLISSLINGRIAFDGVMDAEFSSRSLTRVPQLQGYINIDSVALNNHRIGDVRFVSFYLPDDELFTTNMSITFDSTSYEKEWKENNRVGNSIVANGYIYPKLLGTDADSAFYADVEAKEVDLWFLELVAGKVFETTEGRAHGKGVISGNLSNFDFYSRFTVDKSRLLPLFLGVPLEITGDLEFGMDEGLVFNQTKISDFKGGTGVLSGYLDMNRFEPIKYYNMSMQMDRLEFINKPFSIDAPFYGRIAGTGVIQLSGPSNQPFLETINPVQTTSSSQLSIPLLDETEVEERAKFIEFVTEFDPSLFASSPNLESNQSSSSSRSNDVQLTQDQLTFLELFRLNLQFIAPENTNFELVFDQVTNEVMAVRGGGDINILLEDETLSMFGQLTSSGGEYNFVGGDVFSKRFQIQPGGTVTWEGNPQNPRVDITALYQSRPSLEPIVGSDIRIPINLMLELKGNIESITNEYYFEVPTTIQDAQLSAALSILNGEDQKLRQATSLLLTGQFFAINSTATGGTGGFGTNLQTRATQAGLSQLLSSQINTLLNNSISNLDIDLNLNGFDQAELGIALRLFNDRLVLSRQGQLITDQETNQNVVGDLGASFQINRALSVEVFYRQDPSLGSYTAVQDQVQVVSGVGLQYQVQFNYWKELPKIIWRNILSLFGG